MASVDKVLFVVDRKDLDYQTMREYDRFEKGAANSNTSTSVLKKQLEDPGAKIIITTIQKLATFINANKGHAIYDGHVVLIFDECHRSQFGDMHTAITRSFKRYNMFGFTGTPIFAVNSSSGGNPNLAQRRRRSVVARRPEQARRRSQAAHLHDRRRDQRQERAAVPHRLRQHRQACPRHLTDKQVSAIDTEKRAARPGAPQAGRRLHARALRAEDQARRATSTTPSSPTSPTWSALGQGRGD
jgi:type I restriction enzyme R subunit